MKNKTLKHYNLLPLLYAEVSTVRSDVRTGVDDLFRSNTALCIVCDTFLFGGFFVSLGKLIEQI